MATIHPFRGWRYDLAQVGELSVVTAPPYDVISPDNQNEFYKKHPCNVIRLILNREEPGDTGPDEKYARAAHFLRHWTQDGVMIQDKSDTFYVYHQEFNWEGQTYIRKGFLGKCQLEEFGKGKVFPHEETMSGPKADRLMLTRACKMNLSPIFGLYPDDKEAVNRQLDEAIAGQTPLVATDHLGVVHRLWTVQDPNVLNAVRETMRDKPIFIADGHHRYETALNYRNELKQAGQLKDEFASANFVLMMMVGMSDPGLQVLPTHRLISGWPQVTLDELTQALASHFALDEIGKGPDAANKTWELMQVDGKQSTFGFGTTDGKWVLAQATDTAPMMHLADDHTAAWQGLGVSILHRMVVGDLLKKKWPDEPKFKYVHSLAEVIDSQDKKECQLACLVAPASIEDVQEIASGFEKMPPKSTYFYPKLLSGMVFHSLES